MNRVNIIKLALISLMENNVLAIGINTEQKMTKGFANLALKIKSWKIKA